MKKSDIKLWSTLYNSNGKLCICYKITKERIYLLSTTVSIYPIVNNNYEMESYSESFITPEDFFKNFPMDRLRVEDKIHFDNIYNIYKEKFSSKKKLLLIL